MFQTIEMRAISKFTCAMVVSFSPLDNIIVISMLWELLHRNVIVSHNIIIQSTLKTRQTLCTNMSMYITFYGKT